MNYTSNYNLNLPEGTDYVNIQDLNDNMVTLDSVLHDVDDLSALNASTLAALTTYVPISSQIVASSGAVDVSLSTVDWTKYQEVVIWVSGAPSWTPTGTPANKVTYITANNLGISSGDAYTVQWATATTYWENSAGAYPIINHVLGLATETYAWQGNNPVYFRGNLKFHLFPAKDSNNYLRARTEGALSVGMGGSDSLQYSNLSKVVLSGPTGFTLMGATIQVLGVL